MKDLKETKTGKFFGGRGLYIILAAVMLAAGGAGIAAYNRTVSSIEENLDLSFSDSSTEDIEQAANKSDDVSKEDDSSEEASAVDLNTQPNVMPVNGEIINPFSNGELVKSETLGVWKTHDGVDIKAEAGTQVKAMNHGTVTKVWEDSLWGNCIILDHGDGIQSHYYNLSKAMTVIVGDEVDSGEVIGAIGDTAEIEAAQPSHLHFAVKRNGEWIDPISFIDPNSNK